MKSKDEYLKEIQEIAVSKRGKCLAKQYINTISKLEFCCDKGHKWKAAPKSIKEGTWCPECYLNKEGHYKEINEIINLKGGKCLSGEYINAHTPLKFQCSLGHQWKSKPNAIKMGNWCPICSQGMSERMCRNFFEEIFKVKFQTTKFKWLLNIDGNQMHLDGYNDKLRIAFEYHGIQHYKFKKHWFKTEEEFKKRKLNDIMKRDLCKEKGIKLFEIPYTIKFENMEDYIKKVAVKFGINIHKNKNKINWQDFHIYPPNKLKELNSIAKKKGGLVLSTYYYNNRIKLEFCCSKGHKWKTTPYRIKSGDWCPTCYKESLEKLKKQKDANLRDIIEQKGGKLLSPYINKRRKISVECPLGHIWETLPFTIESGTWCPFCHHNKEFFLKEIKEIAEERGGKCLSEEYINNKTKMEFQCIKGHKWMARPKSIKEGTWCPLCYFEPR